MDTGLREEINEPKPAPRVALAEIPGDFPGLLKEGQTFNINGVIYQVYQTKKRRRFSIRAIGIMYLVPDKTEQPTPTEDHDGSVQCDTGETDQHQSSQEARAAIQV